jgi:hypothetical protein
LSVVHISFWFVVSPGFKRTCCHKAQAISTGWKNRRIKRELSEFKAQKHLFGRGTAQYANTKTKTQHPTSYRFSPKLLLFTRITRPLLLLASQSLTKSTY